MYNNLDGNKLKTSFQLRSMFAGYDVTTKIRTDKEISVYSKKFVNLLLANPKSASRRVDSIDFKRRTLFESRANVNL